MPECKKCGYKITEEMSFCPNCGAPIKTQAPAAQPPAPAAPPRRERTEKQEKQEKGEKQEKQEKHEKHEKGEYAFLGPLIGGIILIIIGCMSYLTITGFIGAQTRGILGAAFVIIIGIAIILGALYAMTLPKKRNPTP
jgi:hypothetical protein